MGFKDNVELFGGVKGQYDRSSSMKIRRVHLLCAHTENVSRIQNKETSTYIELMEFVKGVHPEMECHYNTWRKRMIREFDFAHQKVIRDTGGLDVKSLFQQRCFLIKYADALDQQ